MLYMIFMTRMYLKIIMLSEKSQIRKEYIFSSFQSREFYGTIYVHVLSKEDLIISSVNCQLILKKNKNSNNFAKLVSLAKTLCISIIQKLANGQVKVKVFVAQSCLTLQPYGL